MISKKTSVFVALFISSLCLGFPIAQAQRIYWADTSSDVIERVLPDGSAREVIASNVIEEPFGIVLDPVAGKIGVQEAEAVRLLAARLVLEDEPQLRLAGLGHERPQRVAPPVERERHPTGRKHRHRGPDHGRDLDLARLVAREAELCEREAGWSIRGES